MQIQRKSNGSAALRIAGRLIFSFPCLLAADGIAALVVSLLFCHASSLDLVNSFPRLLPVCFACKIEERSRTDGGKKEPLCHDIHRAPRKNHGCALPGFVDSKNEEKTERNAGYLVVSHSGGGMLRQGTRKGIRRTPANRGMRAHWVVKGLDISEDVCHGMCP